MIKGEVVRIALAVFHHVSDFLVIYIDSRVLCEEFSGSEAASLVRLDLRHVLASRLTGRMKIEN